MKQLRQIETRGQDLAIQLGDVVRLSQPFRPKRYSHQEYTWAIVAGIVRDDVSSRSSQSSSDSRQTIEGQQPGLGEVVVYLYEPESSSIYVDAYGAQALFSFNLDEIELVDARAAHGESAIVKFDSPQIIDIYFPAR